MNMRIPVIVGILVLAVAGIAVTHTRPSKKHNPFITQVPETRTITQYINASGNMQAKDQISIGSLINGRVVKIMAENNDVLKKDQILAILDNGIGTANMEAAQAALQEAQARLTYQQAFYARQKALYESGQLAENFFQQYTQDLALAQAEVARNAALLKLETQTYNNLFIRAPENGTVIEKKIDLGQSVTALLNATVLFTIAKDLTDLEAHIDVDEADVGMIKAGQEATFTVDAFAKEEFTAKVKEVQLQAKIVDNIVTYPAILRVRNNDLRLMPGMTTNADIKVAQATDVPCIPNKALRISKPQLDALARTHGYTVQALVDIQTTTRKGKGLQGQKRDKNDYIWVLTDQKTIAQKPVQLGITDGKFSHIVSGIEATTKVIVETVGVAPTQSVLTDLFRRQGDIGSK